MPSEYHAVIITFVSSAAHHVNQYTVEYRDLVNIGYRSPTVKPCHDGQVTLICKLSQCILLYRRKSVYSDL